GLGRLAALPGGGPAGRPSHGGRPPGPDRAPARPPPRRLGRPPVDQPPGHRHGRGHRHRRLPGRPRADLGALPPGPAGPPPAPLRLPTGTRPPRSPMNPNTVFSASLVTSLVLWFPSMQACLRGDLDLAPAGLRYLAALVVARLAMTFLARLVNAYRAAQAPQPPASAQPPSPSAMSVPPGAGADAGPPHRRRNERS